MKLHNFYLIRTKELHAMGIYLDSHHIWDHVGCSAEVFIRSWRSKYTPEMCDFLFTKSVIQIGHVLPSASPAFDVSIMIEENKDTAVILSKLKMNLDHTNLAPQHMMDNRRMGYWPIFHRTWIPNLGWRDDVTKEADNWYLQSCQQKVLRDMEESFAIRAKVRRELDIRTIQLYSQCPILPSVCQPRSNAN